jgi:hypothetical protein
MIGRPVGDLPRHQGASNKNMIIIIMIRIIIIVKKWKDYLSLPEGRRHDGHPLGDLPRYHGVWKKEKKTEDIETLFGQNEGFRLWANFQTLGS